MKKLILLLFFIPALLQAQTRYVDSLFTTVTITRDIQYASNVWNPATSAYENLFGDFHEPTGDTEQRRPLVLLVHGGGFTSGDKTGMDEEAAFFCARGYVCFSINHRMMVTANTQQEQEQGTFQGAGDLKSAVRFLKKNHATYRIDTTRIFYFGNSSGSGILATAAYNDTVTYFNTANNLNTDRVTAIAVVSGFFAPDTILIRDGHPHGVIIHGKLDTTVPFDEAKKIEYRLNNIRQFTEVDSLYFANEGHNLHLNSTVWNQVLNKALTFFKKYVWGGQY